MSRSERMNTVNEIKRRFREMNNEACGSGPVVHFENGKKYCDDSEAHIEVIGRTGTGKTQCCVLPFATNSIEKGDITIISDPKGQLWTMLQSLCEDRGIPTICLDFRNPRKSPTKWNPLSTPYRLFRSENPDDNDIASSMISELWRGVYPYDQHSDRFWPDAAANYAKGLTYALFETAKEDQINLENVAIMMEQSEKRAGIGLNLLKSFYEDLPLDSLARRNLASYINAPNDTRGSIHSVAASGLEVFSRSKGLMEMLSEDTLNIMDITADSPFACFIITPDETDVYDSLSGLLISQLTQHLIRVAQDKGGKLPIRVNIILEELGSVGKSIPNLPNLMVASRSRNMRLMLILQSYAQLTDVYGQSKAETINSCVGITIGFSTNSWETLNEWSQRCGERQLETNGQIIKEPLITAAQLAAMPVGTALIRVENRYKFISRLPFYREMYDTSGWRPPRHYPSRRKKEKTSFDFEDFTREIKRKQVASLPAPPPELSGPPIGLPFPETPPFLDPFHRYEPLDVERLQAEIDAKIAELDAKEARKYHVLILSTRGNKEAIIEIISDMTSDSRTEAADKLRHLPADYAFRSKSEAIRFVKAIKAAGGVAKLETPDQ